MRCLAVWAHVDLAQALGASVSDADLHQIAQETDCSPLDARAESGREHDQGSRWEVAVLMMTVDKGCHHRERAEAQTAGRLESTPAVWRCSTRMAAFESVTRHWLD